ncbi:hypothetical protein [Nocardioides sp. InS609-2]|uniref:hypothetical protein n=1 Tax=Nocardioides sp. InS609-2 TaxID=2760705 RepID=UPI0020BEDC98|nr:hypothetical protein [Nocardioides sp. InS609-2]
MMIRPAELAAIVRGEIDLAFRRWARPRLKVGTQMRTSVGLVEVTSVDEVEPESLTEDDARRAGAASLAELFGALAARPDDLVFRVGLRHGGRDPREVLRETVPDDEEIATLKAWLDRLDASSSEGPWTRTTLDLIDLNPGRRAPELAEQVGRQTANFKRDVRKLKERGLTQSLDIGYRLSPRGIAVVDHGRPPRDRPAPPTGTPLPRTGAPASRALTAAGLTTLESLTGVTERDVADLHGVGPFAMDRLREALARAGLSFRRVG